MTFACFPGGKPLGSVAGWLVSCHTERTSKVEDLLFTPFAFASFNVLLARDVVAIEVKFVSRARGVSIDFTINLPPAS